VPPSGYAQQFLNQRRTESRRLRPGPLPETLDLVADPRAREPQAALEARELYATIAIRLSWEQCSAQVDRGVPGPNGGASAAHAPANPGRSHGQPVPG
jgi:hypothetical protein